MTARPSTLAGALLGLVAFMLFAAHDISIKMLGGSYHPFQIQFFPLLFSVPLILALALAGPDQASLRPRRPGLTALRAGVVVINGVLGTYAFATLPLAQCYAIFFTMPIFIALLAATTLGERIDSIRGLAVLAGLAGVVVALDPQAARLQWAHGAALIGAIMGAANYILIRKTGGVERTVVILVYPVLAQLLVAGLLLPFVYVPMPAADLGVAAFMAVAGLAGYILIIAAYRCAPAIVVAPMQYSQILWAAIFGALLFGETMGARTVLGTVIIIASGIAIVARQDRRVEPAAAI